MSHYFQSSKINPVCSLWRRGYVFFCWPAVFWHDTCWCCEGRFTSEDLHIASYLAHWLFPSGQIEKSCLCVCWVALFCIIGPCGWSADSVWCCPMWWWAVIFPSGLQLICWLWHTAGVTGSPPVLRLLIKVDVVGSLILKKISTHITFINGSNQLLRIRVYLGIQDTKMEENYLSKSETFGTIILCRRYHVTTSPELPVFITPGSALIAVAIPI